MNDLSRATSRHAVHPSTAGWLELGISFWQPFGSHPSHSARPNGTSETMCNVFSIDLEWPKDVESSELHVNIPVSSEAVFYAVS